MSTIHDSSHHVETLPSPDCEVVIVGSGFGGLALAHQLRQSGLRDFQILEAAQQVGGTWRDNTYPGAACDVESHLYSLSFAPKADWSRKYAEQSEIRDYLERCFTDLGLRPHVRFGKRVVSARYEATTGLWLVQIADGTQVRARALVSAVGQLARPAYPSIAGLSDFAGPLFHSARWDHACDLHGKRVAVIGTGASAIQFIPEVAKVAAHVEVYQRSAQWILPKDDRPFSAREQWAFSHVPGYRKLYRLETFLRNEGRGLAFFTAPSLLNAFARIARSHMERTIRDPQMRAQLTPQDPMGCKRILISNNYYPTLVQAHVELITERVDALTMSAVRTADGQERKADVVILGTGFEATKFLSPMTIAGLRGVELADAWRDGAEAYKGVAMPGFPNLFIMYGPNTNLGHNSIVFMLEAQARYIVRVLQSSLRQGGALHPRHDIHQRYNARIQAALSESVWEDCQSWYKTSAGRNTNNWPGYSLAYASQMTRFNPRHYQLERSTPDQGPNRA